MYWQCTARPADLKYQTNPHKWSTIKSTLGLDIGVHLPAAVADCSQYSKQLTVKNLRQYFVLRAIKVLIHCYYYEHACL